MVCIEALETNVACVFSVCAVPRRVRNAIQQVSSKGFRCVVRPQLTYKSFGRVFEYWARFPHIKCSYVYWVLISLALM